MTNDTMSMMLPVNRTYKSTVFIMLFEDRNNLLELYNGMSGNIIQIRNCWRSIHLRMQSICQSKMIFHF